ncbi:MAG: response regulator transcription factor [Lentihominibacter sp.]|nr:response regulator transcription factor [Clostridiales bacterium]MDD6765004.1 response regulator transcription factor [Bacillota bacterium]MDD7131008.1 response regulator transcription factor [Bacillota bacterium]MDY5606945.1 response regulator transcription factor [Lentihominibacter sp.]
MALIYIIEDDDSIREIEEFALINAGHKVLGFACARDFYRRLDDVIPDLCLVDIMLPDESGNEIVRKLRKNPDTKNIPVIMVTAKTTEMDLVRGLEDGADDYIKKPFSVMELMSRVKALLRRVQPREVEELVLDELVMNNVKHEVTVEGRVVELTFKEYELLSLFLVNKGIVLSRDTIMDKVWGTDYEGESRTIDMHVKTLRQKLGNYGNRIRTIRNVGYVIE